MYSIILAASISAVVAVAIYAVVTNLVIKTSIRKRREAAVKEAEAEGEMIKKERILQAKEKFIQLKSEYVPLLSFTNATCCRRHISSVVFLEYSGYGYPSIL